MAGNRNEVKATKRSAGLQKRKQELVRNAIWDAAIDLFAERGFDETTIDEIAEAAGVSQRSFFRYFVSKADLLGQATLLLGSALSEAIEACPADHSPAQAMREAVLQVAVLASEYARTEKIMRVSSQYPAAREAQMSPWAEIQGPVAQAFTRRMKHARKGDISARVLAGLTTSLFDVALSAWFETGRRDIQTTVGNVFATAQQLFDSSAPAIRGGGGPRQ